MKGTYGVYGTHKTYKSHNLYTYCYCRRRAMPKIADIEYTPNPNAVKFILKEPITGGSSRSFQNAESAQADPLAAALFAVGNVTSVFYMDRFVTVNKEDEVSWEEMLKKVAEPIGGAGAASEGRGPARGRVCIARH